MNKIGLVGLLAFTAACGGANRGSSSVPPASPPSSNDGAAVVAGPHPPAADASSRYLMGVRFAHPESTLRSALAAFPQYMPPMARDLRGLVDMGLGKVGDLVALDRPIELRFFERMQKPAVVLTAVLRDGVDVRAALGRFRLTETPDGRLEIAPPHPFNTELALSKECEIELSAKPRTVSCSSVDGYLARTRAQRSGRLGGGDDIAIEMGIDLVKQQMAKDSSLEGSSSPHHDREDGAQAAGRAIGQAALKSMIEDLRALELGANLSQDAVAAGLTFRWLDGRSTFARVLGFGGAAAAPPARFFRFPVDADAAFFSRGVEAGVWASIKTEFIDAVIASVTNKSDYPEPIVTEGRKWLGQTLFTGGAWMLAAGRRTADVRELAKSASLRRLSSDERTVALERAAKQWIIFEVDEPGDGVVAKAKGLFDFARRADLYGKSKPHAPSAAKSTASSDEDRRQSKTEIGTVPRPLPAATFHLVRRSIRTDQPKNEKLVESSHILVVPEGDHAWIGFGDDEKTLVEHLKRVLEGQPATGTLTARRGLDALSKAGPLSAGGLFSLNMILALDEDFAEGEASVLKERLDYVAALPSKGAAPYVVAVRPGTDGSPHVTVEARGSTRSLDELIGYFQRFESK